MKKTFVNLKTEMKSIQNETEGKQLQKEKKNEHGISEL